MVMRLISLLIGYAFGLFQTGYLYGKSKNFDLRAHGSGNSGTTNTIRTMGWKAGGIVFLGDILKAVLAIVVTYFLFRNNEAVDIKLLEIYAGAGSVLGHDFPFYLKWKGGKGMACTAGMVCAACPVLVLPELCVFVIPLLITRYVSLSSILVSIGLPLFSVVLHYFGVLGVDEAFYIEYVTMMLLIGALNIFRHRTNIGRLINGTENKLGVKKED